MKTLRVLIGVLALISVAFGWYLGHLPAWIAVPAAAAFVIWGLDLDWRRKKRVADAAAQEKKERGSRLAEQQENR